MNYNKYKSKSLINVFINVMVAEAEWKLTLVLELET